MKPQHNCGSLLFFEQKTEKSQWRHCSAWLEDHLNIEATWVLAWAVSSAAILHQTIEGLWILTVSSQVNISIQFSCWHGGMGGTAAITDRRTSLMISAFWDPRIAWLHALVTFNRKEEFRGFCHRVIPQVLHVWWRSRCIENIVVSSIVVMVCNPKGCKLIRR